MNNYIDDPVFGHMEYRHRWYKTDEYEMFGKNGHCPLQQKRTRENR